MPGASARAPAVALAMIVSSALIAQAETPLQPNNRAQAQLQDPGATAEEEACRHDFRELRQEVEKRGLAAKAAGDSHKASHEEMCRLVTAYLAAEVKWIRYSSENMTKCGISKEIVDQIKRAHAQTDKVRSLICSRLKDFQHIAGR